MGFNCRVYFYCRLDNLVITCPFLSCGQFGLSLLLLKLMFTLCDVHSCRVDSLDYLCCY